MSAWRAVIAVVLVLTVAACTGDGGDQADPPASATTSATASSTDCALTAGEQQDLTLEVDGEQRRYVVSVPTSYGPDRPLPVVLAVHGLGGNAVQMLAYARWPQAAQEHGFVAVAPESNTARRSWDFATPPSRPGSDSRFLVRLAEHLGADPCLDAQRPFLTGLSNGAAMTFAMACFAGDRFAAYGAVAAAGYRQQLCDAAPPASFVYFHGTEDTIVPIGGGATPISQVQPLDTTLAAWAEHDGCRARPAAAEVAGDVERRTWIECDDRARIDAYIVEGGGHTWPGSQPVPMLGGTTESIDATEIMVDFFGIG